MNDKRKLLQRLAKWYKSSAMHKGTKPKIELLESQKILKTIGPYLISVEIILTGFIGSGGD